MNEYVNDVETRRTRESCDRDDRCTPVSSTESYEFMERERVPYV